MACKNCKKSKEEIAESIINQPESGDFFINARDYILKFFLFLILGALITPFIIPIVLVVMFRVIVLSKSINLLPLVKYIGEKIFKEKEEEDDDDELEDDEAYDNELDEDYEPLDKDEIIEINNVK